MNKEYKHHFFLVAFGVALFAILMNIGAVANFFIGLIKLIYPVVLGFIFAFVLNVPMVGFQKLILKIFSKSNKPINQKAVSIASILLTVLVVLLIIALVITMLIPEIISSVESLYNLVLEKGPEWLELLKKYDIDTTKINEWFNSIDIQNIISKISNSAGTLISRIVNVASTAVSGVTQFAISVIIAIYILFSKDILLRQLKRLINAYAKEKTAKSIYHVCDLATKTYSKFLSGQCIEACILGLLIFLAYTIFGIPYASLIGILTAVFAFIPYVGAFASCIIGAFLILLVNPSQVIVCIIIFVIVQFIENQFIYPHVVGTSVGLSPLWTLIAVLIGGSLMGLFGMIFFIPLCAVIITLLKEHTNKTIELKK